MRRCWRHLGSWLLDGLAESASGLYAAPDVVALSPSARDVPSSQHPEPAGTTRRRVRGRSRVAEECEAFVTGRYYEIVGRCEEAPSWVWLNAVAHADRADLERLAGWSGYSDRRLAGLSYLAVEVLSTCDHLHLSLGRAQHEVLVPFELELATTAGRRSDPAGLIAAVRSRLETAAGTSRPGQFL